MNKYINKIFLMSVITLIGILGFTSCTDYLDKSPNSDIKETDPYKNFKNFQGFTEELYNCIPIVSNNEYHTCFNYGEDEYWEPQELRLFARNIDYGDFWGWTSNYYSYPTTRGGNANSQEEDKREIYGNCAGMVSASQILASPISTTWSMLLKKSGHSSKDNFTFCRAWFHFMLMEWWGGMPYIDEVLASDVTPITFKTYMAGMCREMCGRFRSCYPFVAC